MDWFERLTGFPEGSYSEARDRLTISDGILRSLVNGRGFTTGRLEVVSLEALRGRASSGSLGGTLSVRNVTGNVRLFHTLPELHGALFQVASQFNLLEMTSPTITPEDGVARYQNDPTQGPACAIAAGAATIYRNYFAPVGSQIGQTAQCQIDCLADLGSALSQAVALPADQLWDMRNGYALCCSRGLHAINAHLRNLDERGLDSLRILLRVGLHEDVEATDCIPAQRVSQIFCSALPVSYGEPPAALWEPFAQLVLDAAYEATMCGALLNARRGASNIVLLTRLGGGAFGNSDRWIDRAMRRSLERFRGTALDVRLVSFGAPHPSMLAIEEEFSKSGL